MEYDEDEVTSRQQQEKTSTFTDVDSASSYVPVFFSQKNDTHTKKIE